MEKLEVKNKIAKSEPLPPIKETQSFDNNETTSPSITIQIDDDNNDEKEVNTFLDGIDTKK